MPLRPTDVHKTCMSEPDPYYDRLSFDAFAFSSDTFWGIVGGTHSITHIHTCFDADYVIAPSNELILCEVLWLLSKSRRRPLS